MFQWGGNKMADITQEKIRATITIGDNIVVRTPYIKSFNVNRQRGQMVSSFSATVEVLTSDLTGEVSPIATAGQSVTISAGLEGEEKLIFTGDIKNVQINPSWDKPEYFLLNISGADVLSRLEGKRYSRRVQWTSGGMWAKITNIKTARNRKIARGFDKKYIRKIARITSFPDQSIIENSSFVYARDVSQIDPYGKIKNPEKSVDDRKEGEFSIEWDYTLTPPT
jgi:hypothetical protein